MNLNDIKTAVEDLIKVHGHDTNTIVYLRGEKYGIVGIDRFGDRMYVVSEDGEPAVSNIEYKRMQSLALELLGKYYTSERIVIGEYSTDLTEDFAYLDKELTKYEQLIEGDVE